LFTFNSVTNYFTKIKMANFNYLIIFVLFINCAKSEPVSPNNAAVENFMRAVLEEFRTGLVDAGLDPIRFEPHIVDIDASVTVIDGELNEIIAMGINNFHGGHIEFDLSSNIIHWIISDPLFYISGVYNLTGLILSTYPISGNGQWQMNISEHYIDSMVNFRVVDGYVVYDNAPDKYVRQTGISTSFPGFISEEDYGGLGRDVLLELRNNILNNIYTNTTDLIFEGIHNLLQSRFSEMSLIDIVGNYTNPPTTTTTTTSRTTTVDPCEPCEPCERWPVFAYPQESNNMQILSENFEENEDEIIVTRIYKIPKAAKK